LQGPAFEAPSVYVIARRWDQFADETPGGKRRVHRY
jgi:hypothetical protein